MGVKNSKCNDLAGEIVTRAHDKIYKVKFEFAPMGPHKINYLIQGLWRCVFDNSILMIIELVKSL